MSKQSDVEEVMLVKLGDRSILKSLYAKHRGPFIKWAERRYPRYQSDLPDIYQQAFTLFFYNVKDEKFTGDNSSIQTYLFGIAKNLLHKKLGTDKTFESLDNLSETHLNIALPYAKYEASHREQQVRAILENVGEPCKTILTKYYYENFTMESIAENMGYKTAMVAKKKKCECLIKIRKALKDSEMKMQK